MTANLARTASRALSNAVFPTLRELLRRGLEGAVREVPSLRSGLYMFRGHVVNNRIGTSLELATTTIERLLEGDAK